MPPLAVWAAATATSGYPLAVDLLTVATFPDAPEAQLARERLELEGIRAFVLDDQTSGVMPFMTGPMGGIRLQVAPEDAERAREILGS